MAASFTVSAAVIGAGPAGLMAAQQLLAAGVPVELYEAMSAPGRKLLVAGRSGLNLTRAESLDLFLSHFFHRQQELRPLLQVFGPEQVRTWAADLGISTFVGSTGRVFPEGMQAGPLLAAWLEHLQQLGLQLRCGHRWLGWDDDGRLRFATSAGEKHTAAAVTILALGGGSWPQLGSTGAWVPLFTQDGLRVEPLTPANCGFTIHFSEHFRARFARQPLKNIAVRTDAGAPPQRGECLVTEYGLEGGLIYSCGHWLRESLAQTGQAILVVDLFPDWTTDRLAQRLQRPRGSRSLSSHLEKCLALRGVRRGLLYEYASREILTDPLRLSQLLKALPVPVVAPRPLAEAISSAGGLCFSELSQDLMLRKRPGVFCAGEMLDWEAPTGGYLLTACLATGFAAGQGALAWLSSKEMVTAGSPLA